MQLEDKAKAYKLRMTERLSVSKGSSKIAKKSTPRPAPEVYHIHRSCFRELVQELTGNGFEPATRAPHAVSNCFFKKFAPPPLDPTSAQRLNADMFPLSPVPILFSPSKGSRLSVSKGSSKIAKKSTPRPAPKVYHIHRSCFRELVQELTGNGFEPATRAPHAVSNCRFKKFAPPPLGPTSAQRLDADMFPLSPVPILFSPLTNFTPMDWTWADDTSASPISLAYRHLAESFAEQAERSSQVEKPAASPLSPTFFWQSKKNSRDSTSSSPTAI